ncbi:MAG: hypothetical protein JSS02_23190 [Planctomycetes bacterium]|nr:hypothetical protein [Planctomycetota bacterium]
MTTRGSIPLLLTVMSLAVTCTPGTVGAVEIRQTVWGFDGQVVPQHFNIVSLLIDNPTSSAFDGEVRLMKFVGGKQVDTVLSERLYLSQYTSRWIQFYPYVNSDWETWQVSWGEGRSNRTEITTPRHGKRSAVLYDDADNLVPLGGITAIKRFPENLFPPFGTATDALSVAVLDHVPRWEAARQRAFLDWLKRGGRAYLLKTPDGKGFEFTGELEVLNGTADVQRVGSGEITRVARTRKQLDEPFVQKIQVDTVRNIPDDERLEYKKAQAEAAASSADPMNNAYMMQFGHISWDPERTLLKRMQDQSSPEHSWALIFLLGLIYLAAVFPGSYFVAYKFGGDFRITFGSLLGAIGLFSVIFLVVGRRGYNEVTVIHSVAIARQQPDGSTLDVTQWSNAFAVDGGDYTINHPGSGRIYSTCQIDEKVNGEIRNGADAHLIVDMPPFSSRPFAHRSILPGRPLDVTVADFQTAADQSSVISTTTRDLETALTPRPARALTALKLQKGSEFATNFTDLYAVCGRRLYKLADRGSTIELVKEEGPLHAIIQVDRFYEESKMFQKSRTTPSMFGRNSFDEKPADVWKDTFYALLARSLDLKDGNEVQLFVLPPDRIRLLGYAPMPANMQAVSTQFGQQVGYTLYSLDIFPAETK